LVFANANMNHVKFVDTKTVLAEVFFFQYLITSTI